MEDLYSLNTIICFFKSQVELNFAAIRYVIAIIDDDLTPDIEKRDLIIDVLRTFGLNEISYRHGKFSPASDKSHLERMYDRDHNTISYPLQPIKFPLLNGTIIVKIPLN